MSNSIQEIKSVTFIRAIGQVMIIGAHVQFVVPWFDRFDLIKIVHPFFENATFPFFILSGLLFSLVNIKTSYRDFVVKKINSVVLPYIIAILPIAVIYLFFPSVLLRTDKIYYMSNSTLEAVLTSGKNSINIAMWFFPVICLFFITSPLFKWLHGRPHILIAFVVFTLMLANFTHRPPTTSQCLRSFQYFLFPYSFGVLMGRYYEYFINVFRRGVWINLILFLICYYLQVRFGPVGGLDRLGAVEQMSILRPDLSLFQKLFLTLFLFGVFEKIQFKTMLDVAFSEVSKFAFGLHLYHGYFLTIYILLFGKFEKGYGIGMYAIQYFLLVTVCYLFCKVIKILSPRFARRLFSA